MFLCIQSLFGTGTLLLFDRTEKKKEEIVWDASSLHVNLLSLIASILEKHSLQMTDIEEVFFVFGPGPFTAVRNIAVTMSVWKSQQKSLQVFQVPSGAFLKAEFPHADYLFLSAGKMAFFRFDRENPEKFEKFPVQNIENFSGTYGGFFHESLLLPKHLMRVPQISAEQVFRTLFLERKKFLLRDILPEYGAEPNISK
ncbi:hypothetical protein HZA38_01620 [Candidatus Peregrinibacteria bacterium]|nr:hypothetical protein [Candidatus Peregrinibacteria bacterium]